MAPSPAGGYPAADRTSTARAGPPEPGIHVRVVLDLVVDHSAEALRLALDAARAHHRPRGARRADQHVADQPPKGVGRVAGDGRRDEVVRDVAQVFSGPGVVHRAVAQIADAGAAAAQDL